jgi:hypothetical protein
MKNISNNVIVIGIVGLIIGLVLGWMIGRGNSMDDSGNNVNDKISYEISEDNQSDYQGSSDEGGMVKSASNALFPSMKMSEESNSSLKVENQGAGQVAQIGMVNSDTSAWVVVREQMNGVAGNILGASRVDAGEYSNVVVRLLRPTMAGNTYHVNMYKDNGDKIFDHKTDALMVSDGELISGSFEAFAQ